MKIDLVKFGKTLTSRDSGQEAYKAVQPQLNNLRKDEELILDFAGINTFTPSWGDEFITNLHKQFGKRLILANTENPSVKATLPLLEEIHRVKFETGKLS
jgi:hypothetical protein